MIFTSAPVYQNLQQHVNQDPGIGAESQQLPTRPPPRGSDRGSGGSMGFIRPGSMAERARLAKIPLPEAALKCPRCESSNTKFCYFNNYSLTQPRHFCKTCRRYWTRGGSLRNVPVGGNCRRSKKSKGSGSRSKSPVKNGPSSSSELASNGCSTGIIGHIPPPPPNPPFLPPFHHLGEYNSGGGDGGFHIGEVQQFPILEHPSGLYPFFSEGVEVGNYVDQSRSKPLKADVRGPSSLKMEEHGGLNLSRNFMVTSLNDQYWSGNALIDLPGFNSSFTSHLL